jgi:uncharacterized phage protein gp47/JayE
MQLSLRNFSTLVEDAAAAVQGAASQLIDLTVGSTLRAMLEANASVALWMQWLILQVLQMTRAATSTGSDLDSWMADFTVSRLPAVAAQGTVTFSRFVATSAALVPVGTVVRIADGAQSFAVVADTTNAAYRADQSGYVLAADVASVDVPVTAETAGSAGNVQAGTVSLIVAALPGVDSVTNAAQFLNGLDGESDAALRTRFGSFLSSRSRATTDAVGYAVASVRQGLQYVIAENAAPDGSARMGNFVVTVDDGSGSPPSSLLTSVATAVETMRPLGSSFAVQPPVVVRANISMAITTSSGSAHLAVAAQVANAVTTYVNELPIGTTLAWSRLAQIAYGASSSVTNVTGVQVNGAAADLSPGSAGVVKAGTVVVN